MSVEDELFDLLARLDDDEATVVTSVRQPAVLREAVRVAVEAGMDATMNEATVRGLRDRLETFAQRLALDAHYDRHPEVRPSLAERSIAAAELDDHLLAEHPELLRRAAEEVVEIKPDADPDHVMVYAAALDPRSASA